MILLEREKVQSKKLYRVGYHSKLNKFILACVVPWMVWYDRYYEISEEEYDSFGTVQLDALVDSIREQGTNSNRFLFSDMTQENTKAQLEMMHKAILKAD